MGQSELLEHYARRAQDYEEKFRRDDPAYQSELADIKSAIGESFADRRILEIACGTGYWTEIAAEVARHIVATDVTPEMLAIARQKRLPPGRVEFVEADAYALDSVPGDFDAGLANFWFSHVPKARIEEFLNGFHRRLGTGATVLMADDVYVPGRGGELITQPGVEDTFKLRGLPDGSKHRVLKNHYDADGLRGIFASRSQRLKVHVGKYCWWVEYTVK